MTRDQASKVVDSALHILGERFDASLVLVSWKGENGKETFDLFSGMGNWYARQGMAHEFIRRDDAQVKAHELGRELKEEE